MENSITLYDANKPVSSNMYAAELTLQNGSVVVEYISSNYKKLLQKGNDKTSRQYISCSYPFVAYIQGNGFDFETIKKYRKELDRHSEKSASTLSGYYNSARQLLTATSIYRPDLIPEHILKAMLYGVKAVHVPSDHVKNGINDDEMDLIRGYLLTIEDTAELKRLKAMLALMALQAWRQFEVAKVRVSDLQLIDGTAIVEGKRNSHNKVLLLQPTVKALDEYMRHCGIKSGYLFTSKSHNKNGSGHLTERSIRRIWKNIFLQQGINEDKTTHGFRHYCLTKIAEMTKDVFKVKDFGRLKTLEMAKKYVDIVNRREDLVRYEEKLFI